VAEQVDYVIRLRNKTVAAAAHQEAMINDSFAPSSGQADEKVPLPWGGWQNSPGTGRFYWDHQHGFKDSHSLAFDAKGSGSGAVIYRDFKVDHPAELYHMGARVRVNGVNPDAYIGAEIRWSRQDGQYLPRRYTANQYFSAKRLKEGQWTKLDVFSKPPAGVGPLTMSVRLAVLGGHQGIIRFDEVVLGAVREKDVVDRPDGSME